MAKKANVVQQFTWDKIHADVQELANRYLETNPNPPHAIVAIGRGGFIPGVILSHLFKCSLIPCSTSSYKKQKKGRVNITAYPQLDGTYQKKLLVLDDLSDTGDTLERIKDCCIQCAGKFVETASLYIKTGTNHIPDYWCREFSRETWLQFPWESKS